MLSMLGKIMSNGKEAKARSLTTAIHFSDSKGDDQMSVMLVTEFMPNVCEMGAIKTRVAGVLSTAVCRK